MKRSELKSIIREVIEESQMLKDMSDERDIMETFIKKAEANGWKYNYQTKGLRKDVGILKYEIYVKPLPKDRKWGPVIHVGIGSSDAGEGSLNILMDSYEKWRDIEFDYNDLLDTDYIDDMYADKYGEGRLEKMKKHYEDEKQRMDRYYRNR